MLPKDRRVAMSAENQVTSILGGRKNLGRRATSLCDFDALVREGFPWEAAFYVKETLTFSDKMFASFLEISPRTLARLKQKRSRLSMSASDRLFRLARIVSLAIEALEDKEQALSWLDKPQVGLGGRRPFDLIRTEAGAREVEDLLGRIEYGVVS
jgi:putative toxin-antitoxin system antitoxin component (TIGR02293 family)